MSDKEKKASSYQFIEDWDKLMWWTGGDGCCAESVYDIAKFKHGYGISRKDVGGLWGYISDELEDKLREKGMIDGPKLRAFQEAYLEYNDKFLDELKKKLSD